jgi:CO/xanthine dehydrogenase Mo-binding subunit
VVVIVADVSRSVVSVMAWSRYPSGIKGAGEIGTVGTAAAVANAVSHATGRRHRTLPIRLDRVVEEHPLSGAGTAS